MSRRFLRPPLGAAFVSTRMDGDALRGWLESLPVHAKPADSALRIAGLAEHMRLPDMSHRRLENMADLINEFSVPVLASIEKLLHHPTVPLSHIHDRAYAAADKLLSELAQNDVMLAERSPMRWIGVTYGGETRKRLVQALQTCYRRITLAYRVGARPPSDAWLALHSLYLTLCAAGIESIQQSELGEAPRQTYVRALLLALAEPSRLAPGMFDHVQFYIQRHAAMAELTPAQGNALRALGDGHFMVDARRPMAAQSARRAVEASHHGDWLLNCTPILTRLSGQMAALAAGVPPIKVGLPKAAERPGYQDLLAYLATSWGQPPSRRHTRSMFLPRTDAMIGFGSTWATIHASRHNAETSDTELAMAREFEAMSSISEWTILNESALGYGLRYISGDSGQLYPGQLIGLRPHSGNNVLLGVLQRMHTGTRRSLEIGVEVLSAEPMPLLIPAHIVGGHLPLPAFLLPRSPQLNNRLALAAEPGRLSSGLTFSVTVRQKPAQLRVLNRLPIGRSFDLFSVEVTRTRHDTQDL